MTSLLKNILNWIKRNKLRYFFLTGSKVNVEPGGKLILEQGASIKRCKIYISSGSSMKVGHDTHIFKASVFIRDPESQLIIGNQCSLKSYEIAIWSGTCRIGDCTILEQGNAPRPPALNINGNLSIGDYNRIRCCIWVRFKGMTTIGSRNAINEGSELRCDDRLTIGDYNQISYDCMVWDTNTHNIYTAEKRRAMTDLQYPDFGDETEKPITTPVSIGNDCWIGRGAAILRGSVLADKCIVGFGTTLIDFSSEESTTIINDLKVRMIPNSV